MEIKINVVEFEDKKDPVKGTRMTTDFFVLSSKKQELDKLKTKMENIRDKRGEWADLMYEHILKNIEYSCGGDFDINKILNQFEETVMGMAHKIIGVLNFDMTPKQKAIDEFGGKGNVTGKGAVTPPKSQKKVVDKDVKK